MTDKERKNVELFFPYYINQGRLLDIYAILNGGYSEYAEITTSISDEKTKGGRVEASAKGGFKLFDFGGNISGSAEKVDSHVNENKEKKIQTVTSVLSIVKSILSDRGYLHDIKEARAGQFVCLPVLLSINSIKLLIKEMAVLAEFAQDMQKLEATVKGAEKSSIDKNNILKSMQMVFGEGEIFYKADDYAVFGNIIDNYLYQSDRSDLIGTELTCLAQVKRVFPDGIELMKNTIFTKIGDTTARKELIYAIKKIADEKVFLISSSYSKPVYQLEIIALYQ